MQWQDEEAVETPKSKIETFTDGVLDSLNIEAIGDDSTGSQLENEKIEFRDYVLPSLSSGLYELTAKQYLNVPGEEKEQTGVLKQQFLVEGPRFAVATGEIKSTFPPKNATGNFKTVFPHLSFNRVTLPWELKMVLKNSPWLALVLFHENETPEIQQLKLANLKNEGGKRIAPDFYKSGDENINLIQVKADLVPTEPQFQAHVRRTVNDGELQGESAIVFANRLPQDNAKNTVHLISLYDRLPDNAFISLYHWEFECKTGRPDFKNLLAGLSSKPYRLYAGEKENEFYQEGYVGIPHFLRLGFQTMSLYQTPLLPYELPAPIELDALGAAFLPKPKYGYERVEWKELSDGTKMADVSFAAAFHIGQMLTVANKQVAQTIFGWKRRLYQLQKQNFLEKTTGKEMGNILPKQKSGELPGQVQEWLTGLMTLKKIPFNYLVPYEQMLPENSIRFFKLNKKWLKNCLDGMFTIGEEFFSFKSEEVLYTGEYTGFILRSPVVGHYPEMEVSAFEYDESNNLIPVPPYFSGKRSPEVMICCFKKEIAAVEVYLPTGAVNFGVRLNASENHVIDKKDNQGLRMEEEVDISSAIDNKRHVKLSGLMQLLECETASELAIQLLDNSPKVKFLPPESSWEGMDDHPGPEDDIGSSDTPPPVDMGVDDPVSPG